MLNDQWLGGEEKEETEQEGRLSTAKVEEARVKIADLEQELRAETQKQKATSTAEAKPDAIGSSPSVASIVECTLVYYIMVKDED